jgi:hypothetical protein
MYGISFFSNRVWSRLAKKGWKPTSLPPMMVFRVLCYALKASGYNANSAADLWNRVLEGDVAAKVELRKNTGRYGKRYTFEDGSWTDDFGD